MLILRHIPFFAMGILFYRIHAYPGPHRGDAGLIGLCLLAIAIAYPPIYAVVAGVCAAIFGLFVTGRLSWLRTAPLAYLGAISYSLYLLHQSIGFVLIHQMEQRGVAPLTAVMLTVGAIFVLATALTYLVERPALRWIRSAWRSRSRLGLADPVLPIQRDRRFPLFLASCPYANGVNRERTLPQQFHPAPRTGRGRARYP